MDGGFIVLVGCLEMGGTEVGYGLWLKCWGFFFVSRRELGLSLGVLKSGDSWGLSIRLEVDCGSVIIPWSEIRVDGGACSLN